MPILRLWLPQQEHVYLVSLSFSLMQHSTIENAYICLSICFSLNIIVDTQKWLKETEGVTQSKEEQYTIATMHTSYVSHTGALACQAQLQGLLASEDRHY